MSLLILATLLAVQAETKPVATPDRGVVLKTAQATPGYKLVAPLRSTSTYLLDVDGKTAHEWKSDLPPGNAVYLEDNGRLLRTERPDNRTFMGGGQGGRIREMDWDGNVTWEYVLSDDARCLHHDVKVLPNGNVLAIVWELKSAAEAQAAGRDTTANAGSLWADALIEIEPVRPSGGKIVWEWHAFDHLVQQRDEEKPNYAEIASRPGRLDVNAGTQMRPSRDDAAKEREKLRGIGYVGGDDDGAPRPGPRGDPGDADWTHCNGIDWRADLDVIVLSSRSLSEVWVIDHSTTTAEAKTSAGGRHGHGGDFLFRFGNPRAHGAGGAQDQKLFFQHDAQWIAPGMPGAGHLLVFNNGGAGREASSVDEFDLGLDAEHLKNGFDASALRAVKLAWTYTSPDIRSGHISGVQRLANGHTLVSAGEPGLLREVDAQGAVVWDLKSALSGDIPARNFGGGRGGPPQGGTRPRGDDPGQGGVRGGGDGRRGPPGGDRDGNAPDGPPDGPPDGGPRGGRRGGPGGGPGGGPDGPYSFFRADHYSPDHPALRALSPQTGSAK